MIRTLLASITLAAPAAGQTCEICAPVHDPAAEARSLLKRECALSGGPLTFEGDLARPVDLDGTPPMDLVIDYGAARCGPIGAGLYCGSAGCRQTLLLARPGGGLTVLYDGNIHGFASRPLVTLDLHGGDCGRAGAEACTKGIAVMGGAPVPLGEIPQP